MTSVRSLPPAPPPSVVFATSEVAPWSKTGGLGDVSSALPVALADRGHRVMVVSPLYAGIWDAQDRIEHTGVTVDVGGETVEFFHCYDKNVDWVFVKHDGYFNRSGGLYTDEAGAAYHDNAMRFRLLSLAALEAPLQLPLGGAIYGEDIFLVANDWQTALAPVYLAARYRPSGVYTQARSSLLVHNLRHQGVCHPNEFPELDLPGHWYRVLEYLYEDSEGLNLLKAAAVTADRVVTVSETYAQEIQTQAGGWGLESVLEERAAQGSLAGVVNGIDVDEWDPSKDPHLPMQYGLSNFTVGKAASKAALQAEVGLAPRPHAPLIGFVGRLDEQKGVDLLLQVVPYLVGQGCQCVLLGTGAPGLEQELRELAGRHHGQAAGIVAFDKRVAHLITAGSDLFVMPSRFEPCGLNQLYAMRYGTPVIAHATGGLKDTISHYDPWKDAGTGWTFHPCEETPFRDALDTALYTIREHPDAFWGMKYRMVRRDFSWDRAAEKYEQIFLDAAAQSPQTLHMHQALHAEQHAYN